MQNHTAIAADVAKAVFELAISDRPGHVCRCARLSRMAVRAFLAQQPPSTVVMEACGSAHYWGREFLKLGHQVALLPPHQVRPYVQRNKTDRSDAKGMLEAFRNADIKPVPVKTVAQHALAALHRMRPAWISERTGRLNTLRGLLRELGVFIPVGPGKVAPLMWAQLEDADSVVPDLLRPVFAEACREIRDIEARIHLVESKLKAVAEQLPTVAQLLTIPASACSRRPPSWPSSAMSAASLPDATWPAIWASPRASTPAASSATSGGSPSAATATCARRLFTAPAPYSCTHASDSPMHFGIGPIGLNPRTSTTRPQWRWRTRSLALSGRSGAGTAPMRSAP